MSRSSLPPSVAEYILWGDQNEPRIFDFFLENNILTYLHKVLLQPSNRSGEVAKQVGHTHQGLDQLPARLSFDSFSTLCLWLTLPAVHQPYKLRLWHDSAQA